MLPTKVRIKAHTYRVKQVNSKDLPKDTDACVDCGTHSIRIYKRLQASRKIELLLHEVLHALLDGQEVPEEEKVVILASEGITQFIKDNPAFFEHALDVLSDPKKP